MRWQAQGRYVEMAGASALLSPLTTPGGHGHQILSQIAHLKWVLEGAKRVLSGPSRKGPCPQIPCQASLGTFGLSQFHNSASLTGALHKGFMPLVMHNSLCHARI